MARHRESAEHAAASLARIWFRLGAAAALLGAAGSVVGLVSAASIYGRETAILADAATAQDLVNLVLVAPLLVILGWRAHHGHLPAYLVWVGCLAFTVYNYAIFSFSVHFGPLFLLWVAVLGLSTFALIGGLSTVDMAVVKERFTDHPVRWPAWVVITIAALFTLLWLREIVPDLLAGAPSHSASDWRVPTNPVHVLDLAFFLPAAATSGILLLRRHRLGYATAPSQLTWMALTCLPILLTPLVEQARSHQPGWAVAGPIAAILLASLGALGSILRGTRSRV
ncbi:MAG: hypothetical protein L0H96_03415 [Humibacillus sp.]|nr:hypothetical protein [Humibacillus sp.]MDN5775940.1 hypothetical protein [Humibacillus sp.]